MFTQKEDARLSSERERERARREREPGEGRKRESLIKILLNVVRESACQAPAVAQGEWGRS